MFVGLICSAHSVHLVSLVGPDLAGAMEGGVAVRVRGPTDFERAVLAGGVAGVGRLYLEYGVSLLRLGLVIGDRHFLEGLKLSNL